MNLNKENMKKMALLIIMAIVVYNGVKRIDIVFDFIISILRACFPVYFGRLRSLCTQCADECYRTSYV